MLIRFQNTINARTISSEQSARGLAQSQTLARGASGTAAALRRFYMPRKINAVN